MWIMIVSNDVSKTGMSGMNKKKCYSLLGADVYLS